MGSGDWLKNIISLNKVRKPKSRKMKACSSSIDFFAGSSIPSSNGLEPRPQEKSTNTVNNVSYGKPKVVCPLIEDRAATQIQTAFRAFMTLTRGDLGKKQTSKTLIHLHSWTKIQAQIRTRRLHMVEEGGIKRKKLENQLKLDAKLRDLEVEWSGGSHTMDEALARIQQREEAAVKRERAMAYAFSHQWRPNTKFNLSLNGSELATANWGWSWMDRWIAGQPWETRVLVDSTQKKVNSPANKAGKNLKSPSMKKSNSLKTSPHGKKTVRNRKLSYGAATKN